MDLVRLSRRRIPDFLAIFIIAAVVYVPFLFLSARIAAQQKENGVNSEFGLPVSGKDSAGYVVLADNILKHGIFSSTSAAPFSPETFRTPGYPSMLAVFKFLFGSYALFPLVQILMTVGVSVLALKIGEGLFGRLAAVAAAIFYLADPTTVFHSLVILSDAPYVFFLTLSVYLCFFRQETVSRKKLLVGFLAGAVLGFSTIIRPIGIFLPFIFLPFYFFSKLGKESKKFIFGYSVVFLLGTAVFLAPWVLRNKVETGAWGLSSVGAVNFFHHYLPEFLAYKEHITPDEEVLRLDRELPAGVKPKDLSSLAYSGTINAITFKHLRADIFGYAKFHLVKTIPVFLSSGIKSGLYSYNDAVGYPVYSLSKANMTNFLLKGEWRQFFDELSHFPITTLEMLFWSLVTALAIIPLFGRQNRFFVFLFWALILYFSLLTGTAAYARFRLPLAPFLFLLATFGATIVLQKLRLLRRRSSTTL